MEGCFERKACFAMIFSSPMELAYPGLALRRAPRLLMSDCELTRAVARKAFFFHEYGRRVGMVPRSSLKEGKNRQMVEKGTKAPKPTQNQKPKPAGRNSTIL